MASIFTKIVNGEIPCIKIAEDDNFLAFLDIFPLSKGHTLVIPKKEVDYIYDLDEETYMGLHAFSRNIAIAQKKAIPCLRIGNAVLGLEVPHAHIHLVPLQSEKELNFANKKLKLSTEELEAIGESIRKEL